MKTISLLGSTGSIGTQTLEVVSENTERFAVRYLSAYGNAQLLAEQVNVHHPSAVCIVKSEKLPELESLIQDHKPEILTGRDGLLELAGRDDVDLAVNGLVGSAGMAPTVCALEAGIPVALSNKESLVMAGDHITRLLADKNLKLRPVDSEHSAIWQCLIGEEPSAVRRLILTASGGPFRTRPEKTFSQITRAEALNHPNWSMGAKITVDSATMMNKGLEVIEARWLFDMPADRIDILVHPQSIIHSMVEFLDGSVKAQLGLPNMKIPIQYAISYPEHLPASWESLNLSQIGTLTFEPTDFSRFRCMKLAYDALNSAGSCAAVLNVANDEAVFAFLNDRIGFVDIPALIEQALDEHEAVEHPDLNDIARLADWTRHFIESKIKGTNC